MYFVAQAVNQKKKENHEKTTFIASTPIIKDTLVNKDYVCQIRSINHIEVRALEKGYLQNIYIDEGQAVKKGQLLFKIMPNMYQAEVMKAQAEADYAEIEYKNTKAFAENNVVAPNELAMEKAKWDKAKAELELAACKLDVKSAKARFYPALGISAGIGYQVFNPDYLTKPRALMYSVTGDLIAPLINRNAIKADYYRANSKQLQAVYEYQKTILNAYIEVVNSLSKIKNLDSSFKLKEAEVDAMVQSVEISNNLFKSTRADYMEVLLTQREALEAKFELIEIKMKQLNETVNAYRALGGGWQ